MFNSVPARTLPVAATIALLTMNASSIPAFGAEKWYADVSNVRIVVGVEDGAGGVSDKVMFDHPFANNTVPTITLTAEVEGGIAGSLTVELVDKDGFKYTIANGSYKVHWQAIGQRP